jgi:membrane protease YdiL (CAAX protease family)
VLVILPLGILGGVAGTALIYGDAPPPVPIGPLPLWGALYSLLVWPVLWALAEQLTYTGYALPRLEALSGRAWLAVRIVVFGWSVQHCAMPLLPEWRFILWRAVTALPIALVCSLIYLRTRRVLPLIVAHWAADTTAVFVTAVLPLVHAMVAA